MNLFKDIIVLFIKVNALSLREVPPLKRVTGMCGGKDPLLHSLSRSTGPLFKNFSVPQDPIFTQNHTTFPNFPFKMHNFPNFQFLILKIGQNLV